MSALNRQISGSHYQLPIQPIDYIVKNGLGYREGNVIKYVTRHASKNGAEDIKKAIHYLEMILEDYESASEPETEWGEWIDWEGGQCPVCLGNELEFFTRLGAPRKLDASILDWRHNGSESDIIRYRVKKG